jgi:hypothetical protein
MARKPTRDELRTAYENAFEDRCEERRLIGASAFAVTFALTRAITHSIRDGRGPFRNITPGGRHIHHMTFGIIGLLGVGFAWLNDLGIGDNVTASRASAFVYGAGAALTLDEFALWLNLQDDYWTKQGRESIDAVAVFGSLLAVAASGHRLARELGRLGRRVMSEPAPASA